MHVDSEATATELTYISEYDSTSYDVVPWSQAWTDIVLNEVLPATGQCPA